VNEQHVRIAAAANIQRLAGADGDDADLDPGRLLELGKIQPNRPDCSVDVVDATTSVSSA